MTEKIIFMMLHVKKYPKDGIAKQKLAHLIDQRKKVATDLLKRDFYRYRLICADYGIPEILPKNALHSTKLAYRENSWVGKYS